MERFATMLGAGEAMRAVEREIAVAAGCGPKVLITGERGVGKELVARLIHERGHRRSAAFVRMDCAGLPETLLESELFGHVRGSFTSAHKGTIFMDEIGELSLRKQAMVLHFLESEIQRVGADRSQPSLDVRAIAATHRDLVADQRFRDDLFYRLNVIHIVIPPLRERRDDIPYLLRHFLQTFSNMHRLPIPEITTDASHRLLAYDWPGNVRELRNAAERLVVGGGNNRVDVWALSLEGERERRSMHVTAESPRGTTRGRLRSNREVSCVSD